MVLLTTVQPAGWERAVLPHSLPAKSLTYCLQLPILLDQGFFILVSSVIR